MKLKMDSGFGISYLMIENSCVGGSNNAGNMGITYIFERVHSVMHDYENLKPQAFHL